MHESGYMPEIGAGAYDLAWLPAFDDLVERVVVRWGSAASTRAWSQWGPSASQGGRRASARRRRAALSRVRDLRHHVRRDSPAVALVACRAGRGEGRLPARAPGRRPVRGLRGRRRRVPRAVRRIRGERPRWKPLAAGPAAGELRGLDPGGDVVEPVDAGHRPTRIGVEGETRVPGRTGSTPTETCPAFVRASSAVDGADGRASWRRSSGAAVCDRRAHPPGPRYARARKGRVSIGCRLPVRSVRTA